MMNHTIAAEGAEDKIKISIIIPAANCAVSIPYTIESLLKQDYVNIEILLIDGESTDRTVEIVQSYRSPLIKILSHSQARRYEMINKGINQSSGHYLTILFPGDVYISSSTLTWMAEDILKHGFPDLFYCGSLLRENKEHLKMLYRPFNLQLLKLGFQPTSLSACWFKKDLFEQIGKFNPHYRWRGGYEILCRAAMKGSLKILSTRRFLVDHEIKVISKEMIMGHFRETAQIINRFFGMGTLIRWLFYQKDFARYCKLWLKSVQFALSGKRS